MGVTKIALLWAIVFSTTAVLVLSGPVPEEDHSHHHHHHHGGEEHAEDSESLVSENAPESSHINSASGSTLSESSEISDALLPDAVLEDIEVSHEEAHHGNLEMTKLEMQEEPTFPKGCLEVPQTGMCRGAFPMFYFDKESRTCKQFVYGGCSRNKNIHKTAEECYAKCYPEGLAKTRGSGVSEGTSQDHHLTLRGGTGASQLTFTGKNTAARVAPAALSSFTITGVYSIQLHFRTDKPHGLIAFLRQFDVPEELEGQRIQLYIYLKKGHLSVTHVFGNMTEAFTMRKGGLQGGSWHSALVTVDSTNGDLVLDVDGFQEYFTIGALGFHPHYANGHILDGFRSVLWVGGITESHVLKEEVTIGFVPFHGCIQQLSLSSGPAAEDMTAVKPLVAIHHTGVKEHCANNCNDRYKNLCSRKSHCVEHFDHSTCDCFNSGQDGPKCDNPDVPVLSLNGDGYVVHRLYEWMDRVHSYTNRISVGFKTRFRDSILFYASAEYPERQYIAASLTRSGTLYVEINLGGGAVSHEFGENLDSEVWHTLSIIHQHEKISLYIDSQLHKVLTVPGNVRYFHLDPDFYLGHAPDLPRVCGLTLDSGSTNEEDDYTCSNAGPRYYYDKNTALCHRFNYTGCGGNANRFDDEELCMDTCFTPGLHALNAFMGCMQNVFFNDISILQSLKEKNKTTRYYGSTKEPILGNTCNDTKYLSVTFSTEKAAMVLMNPEPKNFHLTISFRPTQPKGVLASGYVRMIQYESVSNWELRHDTNHLYFYIHDNLLAMKSDGKIKINNWNYVEIYYKAGRINMMVNNKKQGKAGPGKLKFSPKVTIGKNILDEFPGYIGCIRKLFIGHTKLDLRTVVGTPMVNKDVTYDNCQVLSPCEGPQACEHGGKCSIDEEGEVQCDCSSTGYTGKKCHFTLYRRSCEQYRQIGLKEDGIYHIDLDGNGPLPPAYVKCSFSSLLRETYTNIEHNLEREYEVRKLGLPNFKLDVKYRDFNAEMLKEIVSQSKSCSQKISYQCRKAPLHMSTDTWFSSPSKDYFSNFASREPGVCRCSELQSCAAQGVVCNCDINDGRLRKDEGIINDPEMLPVTSMVFLQGKDQQEGTEAHMTLSSLTCVAEASKEYTVSFTEASSYLEVPAWREGSLSLAFRTSSKKAIVAYQPAYHPKHATFMISLVGEKELEFVYQFRGEIHHHVLRSLKLLNDGEWHHILVDVYNHQLRFVINSEEKLIEVDPNAYLGVLDGSMFLGGIPENFRERALIESTKLEGLIGCIQGLTLNDQVIDMERLYRASTHGVHLGCTPACDPNPCQNGARCVEMWGNFECECANPLAHSGRYCENDINQEAITFTTEESKITYFENNTLRQGDRLFNETFYLNFRTHSSSGLLLFAYDYLHNFVQLYLSSETEVTFLFNHGNEIKTLSLTADDGVFFNNGQSVQIRVHRSEVSTCLHVFTEGVLMKKSLSVGPLLLQDDQYEQYPYEPLPDMVHYPHSMTKPVPFVMGYLGGANDKQRDIESTVPGIKGCIRGLKVGDEQIQLKKFITDSQFSTEGVAQNCKMACDQKPCLNGGKCTEDFQYYNNFHCNCKGTSYTGATCSSEIAYTFHGDQWIKQYTTTSPFDGSFTFELAFSASIIHSEKQAVAFLRSTNPSSLHDYVLVHIDPDGSIVVESEMHDFDEEQVNGATVKPSVDGINAFDGLRHHVIIKKTLEGWTVKIDGENREVHPIRNVYDSETPVKATPTSLYLGGIENTADDRMAHYQSFRGCISNVRLSTPQGESYPLRQYSEGDLHLANKGLPGQGACAGFALHSGSYPMLLTKTRQLEAPSVMGTEWVYREPEKVPYVAVAGVETPKRDTVYDNVVPTVAGIILAASFVIAVLLLLKGYMKKRKMRKAANEKAEKEEKKPLFNGQYARGPNIERTNTVHIVSDAQEMVPLTSAPDGIPLSSSGLTEDVPQSEKPDKISLEETKDVPEVAGRTEEPESPEITGHTTEEVRVHFDEPHHAPKIVGCIGKGESSEDQIPLEVTGEIQVHTNAAEEADDIQEGKIIGASSECSSTSESSIECTIDISATPPSSPTTSKSAPDVSDGIVAKPPQPIELHISENIDNEDGDDDSDPEPILKKYAPLSGATEESGGTPDSKPAAGGESVKENENPIQETEGLNSDSKQSEAGVSDETKVEEGNEVEIDFSKVPVIRIEKHSSDEGETIVDVEAEADQISKESEVGAASNEQSDESEIKKDDSKKSEESEIKESEDDSDKKGITESSSEATESVRQEEKEKKAGSDDEFEVVEFREDKVKVEEAQRVSKDPGLQSSPDATSAQEPKEETETVAELEVPSANKPDDSSVDRVTDRKQEPDALSSDGGDGIDFGAMLERPEVECVIIEKQKDTNTKTLVASETKSVPEGGEVILESDIGVEDNSYLDGGTDNEPLLVSGLSNKENEDQNGYGTRSSHLATGNNCASNVEPLQVVTEAESSFPEDELVASTEEGIKREDISEKDWSLLTQWSEKQRCDSEEDNNSIQRISFTSDSTDGDFEGHTYHSYINYGLDDSDILEDLTDPPHHVGHIHPHEETKHLDTIQESDESEEDSDGKKITMLSPLKSNFSGGMLNLQDISSDSIDDIAAKNPESEERPVEDTDKYIESHRGELSMDEEEFISGNKPVGDDEENELTAETGTNCSADEGRKLSSEEKSKRKVSFDLQHTSFDETKGMDMKERQEEEPNEVPGEDLKSDSTSTSNDEEELSSRSLSDGEDHEDNVEQSTGAKSAYQESTTEAAAAKGKQTHSRIKQGRITKRKKDKPIFLSEGLRTFSNPISYFGGPTIEYDEKTGEGRVRQDSLTSTASLD